MSSLDLVTTVESVDRKEDETHVVEVLIEDNVMLPVAVQKVRARGRAMIATGAIEAAGARLRDIASAVTDLDFDTIDRNTEVIGTDDNPDRGRRLIRVKVN